MVEVSRSGVARRTIFCRNVRQNTDRIDRTVGDLAISRSFLRAVLTAIITPEGGFTDRHRKHRPPVIRTFAGLSPCRQ